MADKTLSQLTSIGALTKGDTGDVVYIVAGGNSRKAHLGNLTALDTGGSPKFANETLTGYLDMAEIAAPASPASNVARLFSYDLDGITRMAFKRSDGSVVDLASTGSTTASLRDYGAVGDGVTNDNSALAAAIADINAGTITALFVPSGEYLVSPGHVITKGQWSIYGEGSKSSKFLLASAGNFLEVEAATATTFRDVEIRNLLINYGAVNNPQSGCALYFGGVDSIHIMDVDIYGFFQGVDLAGCWSIIMDNIQMFASSSWSEVENDSFGLRIRKGGPTDRNSTSLWLSNFAISGSTPPNNYFRSAMVVQGCDAIWAVNGHIGFADFADLYINPQNDVNAFILNIEFHNVYFDGGFGGGTEGAGIVMFGSATPVVDAIGFIGCQVNIHDGYGANILLTQLRDLRFTGCTFRENGKAAILVADATNVSVTDSYFRSNNAISGGGHDCLTFDDITGLNISGNHVMAGTNAHPNGINIQAGCTNGMVLGNYVSGHTAALTDGGTGTVIYGNQGIPNNAVRTNDTFYAQATAPGIWLDEASAKGAYVVLASGTLQFQRRATNFGAFEATPMSVAIAAPGNSLTINSSGRPAFANHNTTASGANAFLVTSGGELQRSTSSLRYKRDVEDLDSAYADRLLQMRPVWYRSTCESDNPEWSYYGLIAEEVVDIDPRLVSFNAEGQPEGIDYMRISILLLDIVKRQEQRLKRLEASLPTSRS